MPRKKASKSPAKEILNSISKLPLSYQRKIIAPLEKILKEPKTKIKQEADVLHKHLLEISQGPRLVTHIDEDGLVSAVIMCAVNQGKYAEIVYTDYKALNEGSFTFLLTDDVVDLPQPRNPKLDKKGELIKKDDTIIITEITTNFWADHHETGSRGNYAGEHLFDPSSPSCASLLYKHFIKKMPSLIRFKELVEATDMVDSARYRKPSDPYNINNPAVLLRLMLTNTKRQKDTSLRFKEKLIKEAADKKNDSWEKVRQAIYNPIVVAIANEALAEFEIYRKYIKPFIKSEHGVTIKIEEDKRQSGLGIKDRYYPQTLYPENIFLLDCWKNFIGPAYSIGISENPLARDENGQSKSQLIMGEELQKIVQRITGTTGAGGHKGIGMFQNLPADKRDEVIDACKELLFKETKRLGYY
ncbi:hypothetical protein JW756_06455 [Candidatus Woesearchaeota archaeon]|nr:hypothetical protein [Candidatus Woesearchaeota archaeon]